MLLSVWFFECWGLGLAFAVLHVGKWSSSLGDYSPLNLVVITVHVGSIFWRLPIEAATAVGWFGGNPAVVGGVSSLMDAVFLSDAGRCIVAM